ncbi:endolytic transglycosylase MltG [Candidatus Saccharibacteria bacterium]|nr:endolytic transglycosylase MltG [Candidatus Saccharibacteria bacterium]
MPKLSRTKRQRRLLIPLIFLVLVLGALSALTAWYKLNLRPVDSNSSLTKEFVVTEGSTSKQIAEKLAEKKLIRNALAFRIYLKLEAKDKSLKAGNYYLAPNLAAAEIIAELNKGAAAKTFRITFLPGATLASARERLLNVGYKEAAIDAAFKKTYDHPLLASKPAEASLEGFIYGDTYEFFAGVSVESILERTFDEMYDAIKREGLEQKFQAHGLNLYQGIVLASIVQGEAGRLTADMPKVAQIFLNRLKQGTPLGSDIVIGYRADQINPDRSKTDMSYLYSIECPWNSRRCAGLPPTAVNNPGINALKAVANPDGAYSDYYYFLTGDDGQMYYAKTFAEHENNRKNHCKVMCEIL